MSDARMPPRAAWPSFPWKDSGWWFTVAAAIAALVFYLAPSVMELDARGRILVAAILAASPVPFIALRYVGAIVGVFAMRVYFYPGLYRMLEQRIGTSDALTQHLNEYIEGRPRYEIMRVYWFRDRREMYLLIRKKRGPQPDVGTSLTAYDIEDRRLMAELEIIEIRSDGYLAKVAGYVDRLWLGEVMAHNLPELPPPARMSAFVRPKMKGS